MKINFEIDGIVPLKMDRYHGLPDPKTTEGYQKQAEEKCYRDAEGNLAIPSSALKAVMRYAAGDIGKKMEARKNRQSIQAGIFISPLMLSLDKKNHDGIAQDLVTRKGQGDKVTRVMSYRPIIKEWTTRGEIISYNIPINFIKQCLELGGVRYGLLSHRPEFGRYTVSVFEVEKE